MMNGHFTLFVFCWNIIKAQCKNPLLQHTTFASKRKDNMQSCLNAAVTQLARSHQMGLNPKRV